MKTRLRDASHLVQYPVHWVPLTADQGKAAIVGFSLSDGTIAKRGEVKFSASFYGEREGLESTARCFELAYGERPSVGFKKGSRAEFDSWQIQVGGDIARDLVASGAVVGKKVEQTYQIPGWIIASPDVGVRRAFMAALWGAEGSSPCSQYKKMRMPVMSMHKRADQSFDVFFEQARELMAGLGVACTVRSGPSSSGVAHRLFVDSATSNMIAFLENCGYLFCAKKADKAWLWAKYLRAMEFDAGNRRKIAREAYERFGSYNKAAAATGMTKAVLWKLVNEDPAAPRAAKAFPRFEDWVGARRHNGGLRLSIAKREVRPETQMFNVLVSSPDHSYLLADGTDNYNSFETATGRIYSDYSEDNHTTTTIQPHERLMWAHDFNFTPMSSAIGVKRGDAIHLLDEIVLESAVARQAAEEFVHRYAKHANKSVIIYGDPAGKAGEKHAHASDYTEIERVLRQAGWSVERRVASKAPAITARQAAVRAAIKSAAGDVRLLVNPHTASWCHRALATVQYLPGSAYQEDQRNQYQHISTAIGYMIHREGNISGARGVVGLV